MNFEVNKKFNITSINFALMKKNKILIFFIIVGFIIGMVIYYDSNTSLFIKLLSSCVFSAIFSGIMMFVSSIIKLIINDTLKKGPKESDDKINNTTQNNSLNHLEKFNSFVAIDFETATNKYNSACSIGVVKVENKQIVSKDYYLIQPPNNEYLDKNIEVHGINPEQTQNADTFPEIWGKILPLLTNAYVVAHYAKFDMAVLKAVLTYYHLDLPNFNYIDSIDVNNWCCSGGPKNLKACCKRFNIPINNHHNALDDAEACAKIVLYGIEHYKASDIYEMIYNINSQSYSGIKICKFEDVPLEDTAVFK